VADHPRRHTKRLSISDRCVLVEGKYSGGAGGHFGMFNGTIEDVLREPHVRELEPSDELVGSD
jgi:hypothetical protein